MGKNGVIIVAIQMVKHVFEIQQLLLAKESKPKGLLKSAEESGFQSGPL